MGTNFTDLVDADTITPGTLNDVLDELDAAIEAIKDGQTFTGNIVLDDGSGDSPAIQFVGGSNDDTAQIFLDDDATGGDSDLVAKLVDAAGDSKFVIQDNAGVEQAAVDSDGKLTLNKIGAVTLDGVVTARSSPAFVVPENGQLNNLIVVPNAAVSNTTPVNGTSGTYDVDAQTVYSVPAGVNAVILMALLRDSGSAGAAANSLYIQLYKKGETNSTKKSAGLIYISSGTTNDTYTCCLAMVPVDADGNFTVAWASSGAGTLDVVLYLVGYTIAA